MVVRWPTFYKIYQIGLTLYFEVVQDGAPQL